MMRRGGQSTGLRTCLVAGIASLLLALPHQVAAQQPAGSQDACAVADALVKGGEKERARKEYVKALRKNPKGCAADKLKTLNASAPPESKAQPGCDEARALEHADLEGDAFAAYKAALKADPLNDCAKKGVMRTKPDEPDWFTSALGWLGTAMPNLLLLIGAIVLLVFLTLMLGYFRSLRARMIRLPVFGRLLRPRLTIKDLADDALEDDMKVGGPIAARIKERLAMYNEEVQGDGDGGLPDWDEELDYTTGTEGFVDLVSSDPRLKAAFDKASEISDKTKAVAALADLMYAALPIPRLTVSGVLNPPANHVASATVLLESDATQSAAVTLTRRTVGAPTTADLLGLAEPAAVWARYEVARAVTYARVRSEQAESYALVREGLDRWLAGDGPGARTAYRRALTLDPGNSAATVNRATLEARLDRNWERAIAICDEGLAALTGEEATVAD